MRRLEGKFGLVTGVASPNGIGFAIATRLAAEGMHLLISDQRGDLASQRALELRAHGAQVDSIRHDVTSADAWEDARRAIQRAPAAFTTLVNNAGILRLGHLEEIPRSDWDTVLATNLTAAHLGTQALASLIREAGGGSIVNMCSLSGIIATPNCAAYSAAKGGLRAYTKCAAIDLAKSGIRVNSVHPGFVMTDMQTGAASGVGEEAYSQARDSVPLARFGTPADVAGAVAFLVSDDAAYVTGSEIVVDGGLLCSL